MLGTEATLRSGHLLLVMLVGSSIILGFSYLNEMYQRIQLQTDIVIVERQTQFAASERSVIQHKLTQTQLKLEAANHERKRLQDIHQFQSQQQSDMFEKEKQTLLETLSVKEKTTLELQDQYESLKVRFEDLHLIMEQFEKNQSRLLEKFATQSTQCMKVISMMSELCNKDKKIQNILPFLKAKKKWLSAVTSQQSYSATSKPENMSIITSPQGGVTEAQIPLMSKTGTRRFIVGLEVNDPDIRHYNTFTPKTIAQELKAQEKLNSTTEQTVVTLQNNSLHNQTKHEKIIIHNTHKNSTTKRNQLLDLHRSTPNRFENVSSLKSENEGIAQTHLSLQLTTPGHMTTSKATINVTQEDKELNLMLLESRTEQTTIRRKDMATPNSVGVYKTEKKDDVNKKEKKKQEEVHLNVTVKDNYETTLQNVEPIY